MINVGIVGGSGYTAGELLRLLLNHTKVTIDFVYSTTNAGKPIAEVHQDLIGETDLLFGDKINTKVDVLFLCLGHGNSKAFIADYEWSTQTKIIDLSNDFRLHVQMLFLKENHLFMDCLNCKKKPSKRVNIWPIQVVLLQRYNWLCCH